MSSTAAHSRCLVEIKAREWQPLVDKPYRQLPSGLPAACGARRQIAKQAYTYSHRLLHFPFVPDANLKPLKIRGRCRRRLWGRGRGLQRRERRRQEGAAGLHVPRAQPRSAAAPTTPQAFVHRLRRAQIQTPALRPVGEIPERGATGNLHVSSLFDDTARNLLGERCCPGTCRFWDWWATSITNWCLLVTCMVLFFEG